MEQVLARPATPAQEEFRPFPNIERRNWLQSRIEIPLMVAALALPRGVRVLEVGCGRGVALPVFRRLLEPVRLVGLDIDPALLDEAAARLRLHLDPAELVRGDVRALPFDDSEFDLIVDFGTCYHISNAARALREIERVLAPGGTFATETKASQVMAHPVRTLGRWLPWQASALLPLRHAGMWQSRRRV